MPRTPAIPMDNPFHGSYECELSAGDSFSILQYHAVIPGSDDHQVKELGAGASGDGVDIEGVAQHDALEGESVKVVYFGITWAYNIDGVTRNDLVEAIYDNTSHSTNGRFKTITGASYSTKMISGIALEDAVTLAKFKLFLTRAIVVKAD